MLALQTIRHFVLFTVAIIWRVKTIPFPSPFLAIFAFFAV
jgi:hypothetical protein